MKYNLVTIALCFTFVNIFSQNTTSDELINQFDLANVSSPAFVLINESPTEIYIPENLKALTIHALSNIGENLSIELNPYYFFNKKENRTFHKYIGIEKKEDGKFSQNHFSGIFNAMTISFAYANKEFENFSTQQRRVFSLGLRTKLLRFYNKKMVDTYYEKSLNVLKGFEGNLPFEIIRELSKYPGEDDKNVQKRNSIIEKFKKTDKGKSLVKEIESFEKEITQNPLKPIFQIDGAIGYSALFKENNIGSGTLHRFGVWLTSEFSMILNKNSKNSKGNNYLNLFLIGRYVEDGFYSNEKTLFYRDFGGKAEFEFGKFSFAYEYIKRNGGINNTRSVGSIKYLLSKNMSLNGGFGKDFNSKENLVTLFGINFGINNL